MEEIVWIEEKNLSLIEERGISFEEILEDIKNGKILDCVDHPNQKKYPGQKILIVEHQGYCYLVPYLKKDNVFFFMTIIPSRKKTKEYLKKGGKNGWENFI